MIRVALIGAGMIVNSAHIPAYRHRSDVFELVAVFDAYEPSARNTAENSGIPAWYTDAKKMLEEVQPDLVSVCVPNSFHKEYVTLALSAGCHVLCEKPLAFTYRDAVEMYDLANKQGKLLVACQSMRYTPDRLAAKAYIDAGQVGDIYYADFSRIRRRGIPTWGRFHMKSSSCGGALVDIGVHMLDAMLWLMGNPKIAAVTAACSRNHAFETGDLVSSGARTGSVANARVFNPNEMDVEDFAAGSIRFENGCVANFNTAWAANMPESSSISLVGRKKGVFLPSCEIYYGADGYEKLPVQPDIYGAEAFPGHFHIVDNLADVLTGKGELEIKPEETIQVSAVMEMFYRSAQEGREICFRELEGA